MKRSDFSGMKITVMGLGLHGGGIETTRFLANNGALVTVTDLRDESVLAPSIEKLAGIPFRTVFGRHEEADFRLADMVIKNPAVRPGNSYIALSRCVETDLSLFFSLVDNPIIAVTGSKGKSTCASAIHYGLLDRFPHSRIGGNITISPLSFLDELAPGDPVVMELSSFQLGDLVASSSFKEKQSLAGFPPFIAIITSIFQDHQDYYHSMPAYIADKEAIFRFQRPDQHAIFLADDNYGPQFAAKSRSQVWFVSRSALPGKNRGAWLEGGLGHQEKQSGWLQTGEQILDVKPVQVLETELKVPGEHHRLNLLFAATALHIMGLEASEIKARLAAFPGVEHRLETIVCWNGITFINDSAATIPEATWGAVSSFTQPVHLIAGGTDKALEFDLFPAICQKVASLNLLKGTASTAIAQILDARQLVYSGPFDDLNTCIAELIVKAQAGDIILLSPGCASFGMFLNEFDRGNKFRAEVRRITGLV